MYKKDISNLNPNFHFRYLLYLILLLPVFVYRDFTPANELKYLSIVDEALQNNTWFTFYNHGEMYADKPPLFFWLLMLVRWLTGEYLIGIIGLFSLLPAMGILILMDRWVKMAGVNHNPMVSNLLLLTTFLFTGASLVMRMDMLMTFFIVLSLYTFFRIYQNRHKSKEKFLLPVYMFLALFSKGPIGILFPLISIIAFLFVKGEIRTFGRYLGWRQWGILLGFCCAWFLGIYWEGGREYLNDILFTQTVGRGVNSYHHKNPVWYYFPQMLWTFAPWNLFYIVMLWQGVRRKMFSSDAEIFLVTVVLSNLVFLSLISSKLNIYLLPIYPFAVYLCSILFSRNSRAKGLKVAIGIPAVVFTFVFPAFLVVGNKIPYPCSGVLPYLATGILTLSGASALFLICKSKYEKSVIHIGYGFLLTVFVCSFMLPQFNRYFGFGEMVSAAKEHAAVEGIGNYAYYIFESAANVDAYLRGPIECIKTVEQLDSLDRLPVQTILFVRYSEIRREERFKEWLEPREVGWTTGRYSWYVLGNAD